MRTATWLTCLWPGLAPLWWQGRAAGLAVAIAFAGLLNFALVATLARPEWLGALTRIVVWCVVATWWAGSFSRSRRRLKALRSPRRGDENDRLFLDAQEQYLQAHWFEAESHLRRLLDLDPDDVDARLMLATLCRHTGRIDDAGRELDRLERMPRSGKWQLEIARERESLADADASKEDGPENGADAPLADSPAPPSNAEEFDVGAPDAGPDPSPTASATSARRSDRPEPPADAAEAA